MTGIPGVDGIVAKQGIKTGLKWAKVIVPILVLLGLAIYIISLKGEVRHLTKERDGLQAWQNTTVQVVTAETPVERRSSVTPSTAADEIRWLGREYRTYKQALEIQSERLRVAAGKATAAQTGASEARKRAQDSAKALDGVRAGLRDPKRSTGLSEAEWGKL